MKVLLVCGFEWLKFASIVSNDVEPDLSALDQIILDWEYYPHVLEWGEGHLAVLQACKNQ